MEIANEILWLGAGVVMIVVEFTFLPMVGFLFSGLAALTVGLLVSFGILDATLWQWITALILTVIYAVLLWKPLTKRRVCDKNPPFNDIIGTSATLLTDLIPGQVGSARWSGTNMKARLDSSVTSNLLKDTQVVITAVEKNILIVK